MRWPATDHCDGTRFFNPASRQDRPASAVPRMLAESRAPWPRRVHVEPRQVEQRPGSAWASVTFVGHSTFVIQTPRATILTDPVFVERASPLRVVGPKRVRAPGVRLEELDRKSNV
mgnify:CR=1 FL=1